MKAEELKKARKVIKGVIVGELEGYIPSHISSRSPGNRRYDTITLLLQIAHQPLHKDRLTKAALELYAYNDRTAMNLLRAVVKDLKKQIKKARRGQ